LESDEKPATKIQPNEKQLYNGKMRCRWQTLFNAVIKATG